MKISVSFDKDDYRHVAHVLENSNVATFVPPNAFNGIAKDGKLKTLAELGGKSQTNEWDMDHVKDLRKKQEERFFFGNKTLYGMFVNQKAIQREFNDQHGYGSIALIWSKRAKEKSIAFLGDSTKHHRVSGTPTLSLNAITGRNIQHWLAQYKIYSFGEMSYVDRVDGYTRSKVKLMNFDVDANTMRKSIGNDLNLIEVLHKGTLSFPYDFQAIVVKNKEWIPIVKNVLKGYNVSYPVFTAEEYDNNF